MACLQSCMTTGNMRVQWSACSACEALLSNANLMEEVPHAALRVGPLLLLLVMLVRDSANFKIRMHAAAALAAPRQRHLYGRSFTDALVVVAGALEGLATGSSSSSSNAAPGAGGGAVASAGGGGAAGGDDAGRNFPNFRYLAGLGEQLKATLLHLLALSAAHDSDHARDALVRRADIMRRTVEGVLWDALKDTEACAALDLPQGPDGMGAKGEGRVWSEDCALRLPADPFLPTAESPTGKDATMQAMLSRLHALAASTSSTVGKQASGNVHNGTLPRVAAAASGLLLLIGDLPQVSHTHISDITALVQALQHL